MDKSASMSLWCEEVEDDQSQDQSQDQDQSWDQNRDQSWDQSPDQNQDQSWHQNQDQNWDQSPDQNWDQSWDQSLDQSWHQNQDQSWHQSLDQSWDQSPDQNRDQSRDQSRGEAQGRVTGASQLRAAWDPTVSGHRVIQRLLHVEQRYTPSMLYVALIQRDPQRREELAKWALEVCCERGCDEAVFPLSVSLMDRFLSASMSLPVSPYCLAAGCILIASKLAECDGVSADSLCAAAEWSFRPSGLRDVERVILATLRWDTAAVTPQDFLPHFLASVGGRGDGGGGDSGGELLPMLRRHSDTLAAMCACDSRFLGATPSLVAAASLNCALRGLGTRGPSQLAATGRTLAELCQTDPAVLQCYSEMIEHALRQRLRSGLQQGPMEKDEEMEDERAGTPTDMREIDF